MKKNIEQILEIPQGLDVSIVDQIVCVKANGKEIKRKILENPKISFEKKGNSLVLSAKNATKRELKIINSNVAHLKNMFAGVVNEYKYTLEICNVHFPVTVKVEGNKLKIKNFLGEKIERVAEVMPNTKVVVKGTQIEVSSPDIEAAGQTAARIEIATKIRNRDRRVFQDGIFITSKPGQ